MTALSRQFLRILEYVGALVLIIAFATLMWATWRYNLELSWMPTRELSSCPAFAPKFVVTSVKGTLECVEAGAARRFNQADMIGRLAIGVFFCQHVARPRRAAP
jgi:TRAP-type C4-dicarboxylate transport system permease small subunit